MIFPAVQDFNANVITPASKESCGDAFAAGGQAIAFASAGVWPLANLAFFIPFRVATPITIAQLFWLNGTAGTDNVDIGIYGRDGTLIISSGSTLTSGASAIQAVDITDTTLQQGIYYMAMAKDGVTNTSDRSAGFIAGTLGIYGILEQTSAFPLPSTATFAQSARTFLPFIGLTQKTVI